MRKTERNRKSKRRLASAERKAADDREQRMEAMIRRFNRDLLRIPLFCRQAQCRRAKNCVGDPRACFKRYWPLVPEDFKVMVRAIIKARVAGHSPEEAARIGEEARMRCRDEMAREPAAAPLAAPAAPVVRAAPRLAHPRIRML